MRVLQVADKPQRRGAEVFAQQLSCALRARSHDVRTLYLHSAPASGERLPLGEGDRVLEGREDHPLERLGGAHPALLRAVLQAIDSFEPDVVQANGSRTLKYTALARRLRRSRSWRLVYRNIGSPLAWVTGQRRRLFYRWVVMPGVDGVVALSPGSLEELETLYGRLPAHACIPNAIDLVGVTPAVSRDALRGSLNTAADAPVILFVGSLTAEKRPDRLARIAHSVLSRVSSGVLWIAGEGPLRASLEEAFAATGLTSRVRLLGLRSDVPSLLAASDALVLTSDTEGMPAVVLEAGALGVPVVSTRVGALAACVNDGETGLLVASDDEAGFAAAVTRVLEDDALRARLGAGARAWVSSNFGMDRAAERYEAFYRCLGAGQA